MLLIRGGTLIDGAGQRRGDVLVDGERIAAAGADLDAAGAEVMDAGGALVIPGAIDVHTHFDLPVGAVRSADDFESGTVAAACGGTTCVIDFAGAGRESPDEALREWHAKADGRAVVDYGFHLTVTSVPEDAGEARALFGSFAERGVTSVKLYLAYPDRLMVDDGTLARAFEAGSDAGVLVCVHAEDGLEVERRKAALLAEGRTGPDALPESRPPEVEAAAIARAAALASAADAAVYVVHLSSEAGLRAAQDDRRSGARVILETAPHYLELTAERLAGPPDAAADFACTPPLRADADRIALWEALARSDIQTVATDHCPFTRGDRRRGVAGGDDGWRDFTGIPGGLPGVETRLGLAYQGVREGRLTVERWVDATVVQPAKIFGLSHRKGALSPGMDADVVVFDPEATKRLDAPNLHMRTDHSPYAGREITGWPALTLSRGRAVAKDGDPADVEPGRGRYVSRMPFEA
jgi:dihydropyrimidinase